MFHVALRLTLCGSVSGDDYCLRVIWQAVLHYMFRVYATFFPDTFFFYLIVKETEIEAGD